MEILTGSKEFKNSQKKSVLTIGNFDGLHLGHMSLINEVLKRAKSLDVNKILYTFNPHPSKILHPEKNLKMILPLSEMISKLRALNFDFLILETFSKNFSLLKPSEFFADYLMKLNPSIIIVGTDFSFGNNREGHVEELKNLCKQKNIELTVKDHELLSNLKISSSNVRQHLLSGEIKKVNELLGYSFIIKGIVEKGDQRGRLIGIPTANLSVENELLPKNGVYYGKAKILNMVKNCVVNIGTNPTFTNEFKRKIEVHILDFSANIYGMDLKVELINFIRDEKKFNSIDELKNQIQADIQFSLKALK